MSDLKPCPCCGSERTQHSDDVGFFDCLECGVIFKCPAPKLPDGYRVFRKQLLRRVDRSGAWPESRVADIDAEGRLWVRTPIEPEEIPALVAFLQGAR